jgi:hypothetical protein
MPLEWFVIASPFAGNDLVMWSMAAVTVSIGSLSVVAMAAVFVRIAGRIGTIRLLVLRCRCRQPRVLRYR